VGAARRRAAHEDAAAVLARCDAERAPAYLEASSPRNRALYERHGFAVTEEFALGRGAPRQWRMWRDARPDAGRNRRKA